MWDYEDTRQFVTITCGSHECDELREKSQCEEDMRLVLQTFDKQTDNKSLKSSFAKHITLLDYHLMKSFWKM
jgi:hypothetical protein